MTKRSLHLRDIILLALIGIIFGVIYFAAGWRSEVAVFSGHLLVAQIGLHILVASSADGEHHHVLLPEVHLAQGGQCVGTLQSGDDTLQSGQFVGGLHRLVVVDAQHGSPMLCGEVGVHGSDAWVVESRRDALRLDNLSVGGLQAP